MEAALEEVHREKTASGRRVVAMSAREMNLLWLRDILEHLTTNRQLLEWTEDPETMRVLTEAMLRDLERCQRVCETLQRRTPDPGGADRAGP
jgi:hypothetical protein